MVQSNPSLMNDICSLGAVPVFIGFVGRADDITLQQEATKLMRKLLELNDTTRRVFLSCRGLDTIASLLKRPYSSSSELHWMAIDGLYNILNFQVSWDRKWRFSKEQINVIALQLLHLLMMIEY
jgi:hypothetical protein